MKQSQRIEHITLLRSLAIILVVFAHATRSIFSPNPHMYSPGVTPWWEIALKGYIYSFHMPLFFWVSGFVFYFSSVEKNIDYPILSQLAGKAKRLILPLYTTSFFILLPTIFFFGHLNESFISQAKLFLLCSDNDHLWFLITLFIIFIAIIPFHNAIKSKNISFYLIALLIWLILYFNQPPGLSFLKLSLKYFPFFIIGCLSRKFEKRFQRFNHLISFIIFFILHFSLLQLRQSNLIPYIKDIIWYLCAFCGVFFMYFFSRITSKFFLATNFWKLINRIDAQSYSIYLFHVTFLYIVLYINSRLGINIPVIRIALSFISGLAFPILLHSLISKNNILSIAFATPYQKMKGSH